MSLSPIKAFEYELLVEVRRIDSNEDEWQTVHEFESAYTAADAITQVELRFKHNDRYERAFVTSVRPRHR
jgi:hypothetical protein